jgi:hypothetical protein
MSRIERAHSDGNATLAQEADNRAEACLRRSIALRVDNPYASYGLAEFLVQRCEQSPPKASATNEQAKQFAQDIVEACELLQGDPTDNYRDEWEQLWKKLAALLDNASSAAAIQHLISRGDELGFALEALATLGGWIPTGPTAETDEVRMVTEASRVLRAGETAKEKSSMAALLRYALYSAEESRLNKPEYSTRFTLISAIKTTSHLKNPLWLFDYGMLAFQVGAFEEGLKAFRELRRGRTFFYVPLERQTYVVDSKDPLKRQIAVLRVIRIDGESLGWGRIERPDGITDPVPFSTADFKKESDKILPGRVITCVLRVRPSGLFAERP